MAATAHDPLIQQTLLGEAVDSGPAAVFVMGEDYKFVAVNETACRLLGYERGELLALSPEEIGPHVDFEERMSQLRTDSHGSGETVMRTKSGEEIRGSYGVSETTVARMRFWVSVVFPFEA